MKKEWLLLHAVCVVAVIALGTIACGDGDEGTPVATEASETEKAGEPSPAPTVGGAGPAVLEGYTSTTFRGKGAESMAVAADGSVWTIWGDGVARFDGETWMAYESSEVLSSPFSLDIAPDGSVWTGTADGVARFDGETWTTWGMEHGLPSNLHVEVVAADDGTIWAAWPGGNARFDGSTWTAWSGVTIGELDFTPSLAVGPDGAVWTYMGTSRTGGPGWGGSLGAGVARFDGSGWTLVDEWTWPAQTFGAPQLAVGSDGAVWLATSLKEGGPRAWRSEVSRFDGSTWTTYPTENGMVSAPICWAAFAPDGRLWIRTLGEGIDAGLSSFDGDTWTRYAIGDVAEFAVGLDGTLWARVGRDLVRFTPT